MIRRGTGGPMDEGPARRRYWWSVAKGVFWALVACAALYLATRKV